MIWVISGVMLMSSLFPFHLAVNYFHSRYSSSQGKTNQEKHLHYLDSFIALGRLILVVGIVMFVWGAANTWIPQSYIDGRMSVTSERPVQPSPWRVSP